MCATIVGQATTLADLQCMQPELGRSLAQLLAYEAAEHGRLSVYVIV